MYEIKYKDCNLKYYGQSRWSTRTRLKYNLTHIRYDRTDGKNVAHHVLEKNHSTDVNLLNFVKHLKKYRKPYFYESMHFYENINIMNLDRRSFNILLFTTVEYIVMYTLTKFTITKILLLIILIFLSLELVL